MRRPGRRRGLSWYERIFNRKRPTPPPQKSEPKIILKTTFPRYDRTMLKQLQQTDRKSVV